MDLLIFLRALMTLEGIGMMVDPHFKLFEVARPYALRYTLGREGRYWAAVRARDTIDSAPQGYAAAPPVPRRSHPSHRLSAGPWLGDNVQEPPELDRLSGLWVEYSPVPLRVGSWGSVLEQRRHGGGERLFHNHLIAISRNNSLQLRQLACLGTEIEG